MKKLYLPVLDSQKRAYLSNFGLREVGGVVQFCEQCGEREAGLRIFY